MVNLPWPSFDAVNNTSWHAYITVITCFQRNRVISYKFQIHVQEIPCPSLRLCSLKLTIPNHFLHTMSEASPSRPENPFKSGSESDQSDAQSDHSQSPSDHSPPLAAPASKEEPDQQPKEEDGDKNKKKGNFKKFWKWYTIGVVLGLTIILPLLLVKLAKRK